MATPPLSPHGSVHPPASPHGPAPSVFEATPAVIPGLSPAEHAHHAHLLEQRLRAEIEAQFRAELDRRLASGSRPKLDPPKSFDGKDKDYQISDFLYKLENYFVLARISSDHECIAAACDRLYGPPLTWFRAMTAGAPHHLTWAEVKDAMLEEFTPPHASLDARDQLARLRMDEWKLRNYNTRFRTLCLKIPDLSPSEKFDRYCRGLRVELLREIRLRNITTLEQAMSAAEHYVSSMHSASSVAGSSKGKHQNKFVHSRPFASAGPEPMQLGAAPAVNHLSGAKPSPSELSRIQALQTSKSKLTDSDKALLGKFGYCFYCRQPGHIMQSCPVLPKNQQKQQRKH